MTAIGILLGFVIILQIFVLVGICRTNYKLEELDASVSRLSDLIVPYIGENITITKNITRILDQLADASIELRGNQKRHKKKKDKDKDKDKIYADNTIIKTEKKGVKFL